MSSATASAEPGALSAWVGVVILAGILLVLVGAFHTVTGVATLAGTGLDVLAPQPASLSDPAWGILCLAVGTLEVITGYGVFRGERWARAVAIVITVAGGALSVAYAGLPASATVLLMVVGVVIVYAVLRHGAEVRPVA